MSIEAAALTAAGVYLAGINNQAMSVQDRLKLHEEFILIAQKMGIWLKQQLTRADMPELQLETYPGLLHSLLRSDEQAVRTLHQGATTTSNVHEPVARIFATVFRAFLFCGVLCGRAVQRQKRKAAQSVASTAGAAMLAVVSAAKAFVGMKPFDVGLRSVVGLLTGAGAFAVGSQGMTPAAKTWLAKMGGALLAAPIPSLGEEDSPDAGDADGVYFLKYAMMLFELGLRLGAQTELVANIDATMTAAVAAAVGQAGTAGASRLL